jgi:hypothetical protein
MSTPLLMVLNAPVYLLLGRLFFGDFAGFFRSLRYVLTPDLFSALRGEFWDDRWESAKFLAWVVVSGLVVLAEHQLLRQAGML